MKNLLLIGGFIAAIAVAVLGYKYWAFIVGFVTNYANKVPITRSAPRPSEM